MSVSTYAYVNARIGGMKSYLLGEDQFRSLIESRNLEDLTSQLKTTRYGSDLAEPDVLSLELQLKRSLYRDYLKLLNCVDGAPKEFVHSMAKRFEVEGLKSLIKMKFLQITLTEYLIPFGSIDETAIDRMVRAEGITGLMEELKNTEYYEALRSVHQSIIEKKKEEPEGRPAVVGADLPYLNALDTYYFDDVMKAMNNLRKKDQSMVKRFVGFDIDLSNLLMALRLRGVEGSKEAYFITGGEGLTIKHFIILANLEDMAKLPEVVPHRFVELTSEALEKYNENKSLLWFEFVAKKHLLKEAKRLFLGDRFHIGTIIAYLQLKENEIANLVKIIKTKDEFFKTKEIEELLVLV